MEAGGGVCDLEDDAGLDFIIPLLLFMHRTCLKAVCCFLMHHFINAKYVKDTVNTPEEHEETLACFLTKVDEEGRSRSKRKEETKKKGKQQKQHQPQYSKGQQWSQQQHQPQYSKGQQWSQQQHRPQCSKGQQWSQQQHRPQCSKEQQWSQQQHRPQCSKEQQQSPLSSCSKSSKQEKQPYQQSSTSRHSYSTKGRQQPLLQQPLLSLPSHCHPLPQQGKHSTYQHYQRQQRQPPRHCGRSQQGHTNQPSHSTSQQQHRQQSQAHQHGRGSQQNQPNQNAGQHQQNQQRQSPQPGSRSQQSCPDQSMGQNQGGAQGQVTEQPMNNLEERRLWNVPNIEENFEILKSVKVGDLMQRSSACQELQKLDINFVLNLVLNKLMDFPLDQELLQALLKMKDVRKVLVHPKYHFSKDDFEENLPSVRDAVGVLYRHLSLDQQELQQSVTACQEHAACGTKAFIILRDVASEAYKKYILSDCPFMPPDISLIQLCGKKVINDLNKFIEDQQDHHNLIILSGGHREVKARLLESLASSLSLKNNSKFKLVVHVNERDRRDHDCSLTRTSRTSAITFQDQVLACLTHVAPGSVYKYGLDSVKAAIRRCQKDIVFLINWNINNLDHVRSELQEGTWVLAYDGKEPPVGNWRVLKVEPYTQAHVYKMIESHHSGKKMKETMKEYYDSFDHKDILSSLDMIQLFLEMCEDVSAGTDFEMAERYVKKTRGYCDRHTGDDNGRHMVGLCEAAFLSIHAEFIPRNITICQCLCKSFLCFVEGKGWRFKHSIVRDFMAASYVAANPSEARKKWVEENFVAFKRVFKFVCFKWCRSSSPKGEYLQHMETFLREFLITPRKDETKECTKEHRDPFDSWDLLLELDEACDGDRGVLKCLMSIVSDIPCWHFNASEWPGLEKKLARLDKVLKWATLDKNSRLIMLESNANVKLITEFWKKLRRVPEMYRGSISVTIKVDEDNSCIPRKEIEEFFQAVVDTEVLHITRYKGPLFPSSVSHKFLKCICMQSTEILEASVYDVSSLQKVKLCRAKEMHVRINLEPSEQSSITPSSIEFPLEVSLHIVLQYFPNVQQLLDGFRHCHQLNSLSIHGLHISFDLKLNLSSFTQLESLHIRFEPEKVDMRPLVPVEERMEVVVESGEGNGDRQPQSTWLSHLLQHLTLPKNLKQLFLRDLDFFIDTNQTVIKELLFKYNIKRLVVLDSRLSPFGARRIPCSQSEEEEEDNYGGKRKLKRAEPFDMEVLSAKRARLSEEELDTMQVTELDGMEIVITADRRQCFDCFSSPCACVPKVGHEDGCRTHGSMTELISNMHSHGIQCFSYSLNHSIAGGDECGHLSVECIKALTDEDVQEMDPRSCLPQFLRPLILAEAVSIEGTAVSPCGAVEVAELLRKKRGIEKIGPFALSIETSWHPSDSTSLQELMDVLVTADHLSELQYKCGCPS